MKRELIFMFACIVSVIKMSILLNMTRNKRTSEQTQSRS